MKRTLLPRHGGRLIERLEGRHLFSDVSIGVYGGITNPYFLTDSTTHVGMTYDATSHLLTVDEGALYYIDPNGAATFIGSPTSSSEIKITVGNSGLATGGVAGNDLEIRDGSGNLLLSGELGAVTQTAATSAGAFGHQYNDGGVVNFEFRFVATGGSKLADFAGHEVGVALDFTGNFTNTFATNFNGTTQSTIGYLPYSSLSGFAYKDLNNDGQYDIGEDGIANVTVTLSGTDDRGGLVHLSTVTDVNGLYVFENLRAGTYTIAETQPGGYTDGKDTVGTLGTGSGGGIQTEGELSNTNDSFQPIVLAYNQDGLNYNFGEVPTTTTTPVGHGMTATIGFWHNKNGQALLLKLNGNANSTALGNWLATTFPNIYGPSGGAANNTTGKTNTQIAAMYLNSRFSAKGQKLDAQLMATAFAVYVTNISLAGNNYAASYGFIVNTTGTGAATYNVGSNGAAFGFANNSVHSVMDYLVAANSYAFNGLLWDTSHNGSISAAEQALRDMANALFDGINNSGDIT